jgi:hypothetical protein
MSFTPNIGPARRAFYVASGIALLAGAWWKASDSPYVALLLAVVGSIVALEGAVGL